MAECQDNSSRIAEIVLIVRACKRVTESGQEIINLSRTKCKVLAKWDVYSAAKVQGKRLGRRSFGKDASADDKGANRLKCIAVYVGVRSANQEMTVRLEVMGAHFDLRAEKVSEQIPFDIT